ncbi:MAG TPA: acyl carrier protein [Puia sp.]|jgi:acyl carrier protein|nr:acyl carrier protein [Puia sp.]
MTIREKIRSFIGANLLVSGEDEEFSDADNLFQLGYVNSLFAMKLLNYVEREFDITVDNEAMDIRNFSSVLNIVSLVEKIRQT